MWLKADTRRPLAILILALSLLAWLAVWVAPATPYNRFLSHHGLEGLDQNAAWLGLFVGGWLVMIIAMMLPTTLPLILMFQRMVSRRENRRALIALLIAGYLAVWTLFGAGAYVADWGLHQAVQQFAWLNGRVWLLGPLTLLAAGLYQFTPLKYACLEQCRSPLSFITEHWQGRSERRQALALGAHHGLFCLGCCWALMLLMFAVGAGHLGWMFLLGIEMAIEKNLRWGRKVVVPFGMLLLILAALLLWLNAPR